MNSVGGFQIESRSFQYISTQTHKPSNPTPTLPLPLKGRETPIFFPLQGRGQVDKTRPREGAGLFVGAEIIYQVIDHCRRDT